MEFKLSQDPRLLATIPKVLPSTGTSGSFTLNVPFKAKYVAVLNGSQATMNVTPGQPTQAPADAMVFNPNVYLSVPIEETDRVTVFWTSSGNLGAQNSVVFIFSNITIPVQGGAMTTGGVSSNVAVTNTPSVSVTNTVNTSTSVSSLPAIQGYDYVSANHQIKVDSNGYQYMVLASGSETPQLALDSSIQAVKTTLGTPAQDGTDATGVVQLSGGAGIRGWLSGIFSKLSGTLSVNVQNWQTQSGPQAATQGITATNQVSVTTAATAIFNGVVNGKQIAIKNNDSTAILYLGAAGVTTTTGFPVGPGSTFTMDVQSGSTIVIYGVGSAALTAPTMTVN